MCRRAPRAGQNGRLCLTEPALNHHNAGAMLIEKLDRGLVIHAPAKVNLFLEVLERRTDGYHEIDSIICPVTLFDHLSFEANDSGRIEFSICARAAQERRSTDSTAAVEMADDPAWQIPEGGSNLVVRALAELRSELGVTAGCRVKLQKNIPAAAGLGGGSSDAAAAIVAGMISWGMWDRDRATRLAARLGSDIPLFLGDEQNGIGLARVTGRGEHIEMLSGRPPLHFVISHPPVGSSTAEVYGLWHRCAGQASCEHTLSEQSRSEHRSSKGMLAACAEWTPDQRRARGTASGNEAAKEIRRSLTNALQLPASQLTDWIDRQLECFARLGHAGAQMTGSGSACFSLVDDPDEGRRLVENLIAFGLPRAYAAQAWYAPSIEQQLERISKASL